MNDQRQPRDTYTHTHTHIYNTTIGLIISIGKTKTMSLGENIEKLAVNKFGKTNVNRPINDNKLKNR